MTTATRAAKGGEQGVNGEWYDGGQFLPSSETTVKGEFKQTAKQAKPRKQEIAPYKWEVSEKSSIWNKCMVGAATIFTQTGYSKETGSQGIIEVYESNYWHNMMSEDARNEVIEMVKRWNNGERWI